VNGWPTAAAILEGAGADNGLFMQKAASAKAAIEAADSAVAVNLTTLYTNVAATDATADSEITFTLNNVDITVIYPNGMLAADVAQEAVDAINEESDRTGVIAEVGDGANGGPANAIVFRNATAGDESAIEVMNYNVVAGVDHLGFGNFNQTADANHNTGQISVSSDFTFDLSSPTTPPDDSILTSLGLAGGLIGYSDAAADGILYGSKGLGNGTVTTDATAQYLIAAGDLVINGVDIFSAKTAITANDADNVLVDAINAKSPLTGVTASRTGTGALLLAAIDGRNLHIQTSANGERITRLNGGVPVEPQSKVYFGAIRLESDRNFLVEDTATDALGAPVERGLSSIGMTGGEAATGEKGDIAADGLLSVTTIRNDEESVRYTGDRDRDLAIKVGRASTVKVSKNGEDAIMNTGVFASLRKLIQSLEEEHYSTVTGRAQATDTAAGLTSGKTGLAREAELTSGSFSVTVTDHAHNPPQVLAISIGVNTANDTLESVATRIDGVPGIDAAWDDDGYLRINASDPDRYSIALEDNTSNFLEIVGITPDSMQSDAFTSSIAELGEVMDALTTQVSDFGARANRMEMQQTVFNSLELGNTENLSEVEDTDIMKALMEIKAKELAYQAALSAAAKTMQLSLVDYLR